MTDSENDLQRKGAPWPPPTLKAWLNEVDTEKAPLWYIPGLVPCDSVGVISGPPKSYKTFFSMLLARVLASGRGYPKDSSAAALAPAAEFEGKPAPVWFLEFEGGRAACARHWHWCEAGAEWPAATDKIYWAHRYYHLSLSDPAWVDHACAFVRGAGIKVVFVDTFAEAAGSIKSESDAASMRAPMRALNLIQQATEGGTVMYVHHIRKLDHDAEEDIDEVLRGSSSLAAGYYQHLAFRKTPDGHNLYLSTRSKLDRDRHYSVSWKIDTADAPERASLALKEWELEKPFELFDLEDRSAQLLHSKVYSRKDLANRWKAPYAVVDAYTKQLSKLGMLEGTAKGWQRK